MILDLLFPRRCLGCGWSGSYCCEECLTSDIVLVNEQRCAACGAHQFEGCFCGWDCGKKFNFDQLIVCCDYGDNLLLQKMIVRYKYKFSEELAVQLARLGATVFEYFWEEWSGLDDVVMVPVPVDVGRLRSRGFDHIGEIFEVVAGWQKIRFWKCLRKERSGKKQSELGQKERRENLKGAIEVDMSFDLRGKFVILVDDVCTTGSTLDECARVLKAAGASWVCGFVLARRNLVKSPHANWN